MSDKIKIAIVGHGEIDKELLEKIRTSIPETDILLVSDIENDNVVSQLKDLSDMIKSSEFKEKPKTTITKETRRRWRKYQK